MNRVPRNKLALTTLDSGAIGVEYIEREVDVRCPGLWHFGMQYRGALVVCAHTAMDVIRHTGEASISLCLRTSRLVGYRWLW